MFWKKRFYFLKTVVRINFFHRGSGNNMTDNFVRAFHILIITLFLGLFFNGCGYKGDPVYIEKKSE